MISPFKGKFRVTQPFKLGKHNGLDLVGDDDTTIYAICDGYIGTSTIITDKSNKTWQWGNYVKIESDNALDYYCHLSKRLVSKGQKVKKGDPIGIMGNTGYSFGSHLHFERRNKQNKVTSSVNSVTGTNIPNEKGTYNYSPESEELTMSQYDELKSIIEEQQKKIKTLESQNPIYHWTEQIPEWGRKSVQKALDKGYIKGASDKDLNLPETMVREIVILDRMGLL